MPLLQRYPTKVWREDGQQEQALAGSAAYHGRTRKQRFGGDDIIAQSRRREQQMGATREMARERV